MLNKLAQKLANHIMDSRVHDVAIGPPEEPYLLRWWVIPRNKFFNIYLHRVLTSDDDRALHDHPWFNMSYIVEGEYDEHTIVNGGIHKRTRRPQGSFKFRSPWAAHRLELLPTTVIATHYNEHGHVAYLQTVEKLKPCTTFFVTGPIMRKWGFHCPQGWIKWTEFVSPHNKGEVGRGCGEPN